MKTLLNLLLAVSLVINAVLAWHIIAGSRSEPAVASAATDSASAPVDRLPAIDADTWPGLDTKELPDLASRLREAGFPKDVIRAILAARISESFAARRKALDPGADSRPYWKSATVDPKVQLALRQIGREQRTLMRDLLGEDAESSNDLNLAFQGGRLSHLPKEKADEIRQVLRDFSEQRSDLYAGGATLDREKYVALEKAQRDAIAALLSPQEMLEYDLRNSRTATMLRGELMAFTPTEEEFLAIFRLRQPFDDQFGMGVYSVPPSPEVMRQRSEAHRLLNEQIKSVLAPERAAEYDRATDHSYRQTSQLVARLELPPETTGQIYAVQQDLQARARTVGSAQRAQLLEEATARLAPLLGGSSGVEAYKQYGGWWLQTLAPPSRPGPGQPAAPAIRLGP